MTDITEEIESALDRLESNRSNLLSEVRHETKIIRTRLMELSTALSDEMAKNFQYEADRAEPGMLLAGIKQRDAAMRELAKQFDYAECQFKTFTDIEYNCTLLQKKCRDIKGRECRTTRIEWAMEKAREK